MQKSRKGTIRGVFCALVMLGFLTWLSMQLFDIGGLPAHQIAGLSIIIWTFSCLVGLAVYAVINRWAMQSSGG